MLATGAVRRLTRRDGQIAADASYVEGIENAAVVKEVGALPLLGVAREFSPADSQIAGPGHFDPRDKSAQGFTESAEQVAMGATYPFELGRVSIRKDEAVQQASRSQEHSAPAARTSGDRYCVCLTNSLEHFLAEA